LSGGESVREDDERFIATQAAIMRSVTILRRTELRMKKTTDEIRENLVDLKVAPVRGSDIIVISVDSPSADFARDFANALTEEFLKFRDEQRAATSANALLQVTREVNRLHEELKALDERVSAFAKEQNITPEAVLEKSLTLREDREQVRSLYNALLAQLMKIDATQSFNTRTVSVLEPAILEPKPIHSEFFSFNPKS
jgi:uncharacterized protein involved in exopolysaccharide biosynthesis